MNSPQVLKIVILPLGTTVTPVEHELLKLLGGHHVFRVLAILSKTPEWSEPAALQILMIYNKEEAWCKDRLLRMQRLLTCLNFVPVPA